MLDLDGSRSVTLRELDATVALLDGLSEAQWEIPMRCAGWGIGDLAGHLALVSWAQGEAFHRMLAGSTEVPAIPDLAPLGRPAALAALGKGRDHLAEAFARITPDETEALVPLPFAVLPCLFALQVALIEYGVHRNDLQSALGTEGPVAPEVSAVIIEPLPAFLPALTTEAPPAPTSYRLSTPGATVSVVSSGDAWRVGEDPDIEVCEIAGDESAVSLFAMGRLPVAHPGLRISGDTGAAARFKQYFPGP
jgi:uncharacterized protein (TIGR03083 family)